MKAKTFYTITIFRKKRNVCNIFSILEAFTYNFYDMTNI